MDDGRDEMTLADLARRATRLGVPASAVLDGLLRERQRLDVIE